VENKDGKRNNYEKTHKISTKSSLVLFLMVFTIFNLLQAGKGTWWTTTTWSHTSSHVTLVCMVTTQLARFWCGNRGGDCVVRKEEVVEEEEEEEEG